MNTFGKRLVQVFSYLVTLALGMCLWALGDALRGPKRPTPHILLRSIPLKLTAEGAPPSWTTNYDSYFVLLETIDSWRKYSLVSLVPKPGAQRITNQPSESYRFVISLHETDGFPIVIRSEELPSFGEPPYLKLIGSSRPEVSQFPSVSAKLESIR